MGSRSLALHCTVCKGHFQSKREWTDHLMEGCHHHQELARQELAGSWDGKKRKRALVIFSNQPVAQDNRIIQYFSKDVGMFVTDFVWWPERPRVGFLQFESRKMVEKVMSSVQDHQVLLDGQLFQVKEAGAILDFEWDALLPVPTSYDGRESVNATDSEDSLSDDAPRRSRRPSPSPILNTDDVNGNQFQLENMDISAVDDASAADIDGADVVVIEDEHEHSSQQQIDDNQPSTLFPTYLLHQLQTIQRTMEIPDDEFNSILRLLSLLQQLFSQFSTTTTDQPNNPTTRAILSRNWSLKLKYFGPNSPIFIFIQRKATSPSNPSILLDTSMEDINKHMLSKNSQTLFHTVKRCHPFNFPSAKSLNRRRELFLLYTLKGRNEANFHNIKLAGGVEGNVESELWRLIKYLSTFDPRCEPILAVIYFWAKSNSIHIAKRIEKGKLKSCYSDFSDPFGITWLAILFLCKEDLLPLPKVIFSRSKTIHKAQLGGRIHIGFFEDPRFAQTWGFRFRTVSSRETETFASEVFTLVKKFFLFWGEKLGKGEWVIDSRTGEITEMEVVRNAIRKKFSAVKATLDQTKKPYRLHLTNPLSVCWRINLSSSVKPYKAMLTTGKRLEGFLEAHKNSDSRMGNEEFLGLFKV